MEKEVAGGALGTGPTKAPPRETTRETPLIPFDKLHGITFGFKYYLREGTRPFCVGVVVVEVREQFWGRDPCWVLAEIPLLHP